MKLLKHDSIMDLMVLCAMFILVFMTSLFYWCMHSKGKHSWDICSFLSSGHVNLLEFVVFRVVSLGFSLAPYQFELSVLSFTASFGCNCFKTSWLLCTFVLDPWVLFQTSGWHVIWMSLTFYRTKTDNIKRQSELWVVGWRVSDMICSGHPKEMFLHTKSHV